MHRVYLNDILVQMGNVLVFRPWVARIFILASFSFLGLAVQAAKETGSCADLTSSIQSILRPSTGGGNAGNGGTQSPGTPSQSSPTTPGNSSSPGGSGGVGTTPPRSSQSIAQTPVQTPRPNIPGRNSGQSGPVSSSPSRPDFSGINRGGSVFDFTQFNGDLNSIRSPRDLQNYTQKVGKSYLDYLKKRNQSSQPAVNSARKDSASGGNSKRRAVAQSAKSTQKGRAGSSSLRKRADREKEQKRGIASTQSIDFASVVNKVIPGFNSVQGEWKSLKSVSTNRRDGSVYKSAETYQLVKEGKATQTYFQVVRYDKEGRIRIKVADYEKGINKSGRDYVYQGGKVTPERVGSADLWSEKFILQQYAANSRGRVCSECHDSKPLHLRDKKQRAPASAWKY
jgi:hypothetical protein